MMKGAGDFRYFLLTCGEVCMSPIGLHLSPNLLPKKWKGQMMEFWFVGATPGNLIAGLLAGRVGLGRRMMGFSILR
jgi:POT family proton-dependent oligopeptide transporter